MTVRPKRPSKPSSRRARTPIAATSPSSKAATSSAPIAWCRIHAAKSAAAARRLCWQKRGASPTRATPRSNCWARTSTATAIRKGSRASLNCSRPSGKFPASGVFASPPAIPRDFTRDIVEAIDAVPTLCDHVHLPVQSGSSRVLKMMAREYTREWYLERISWIKAARRPISLSTDIIVGFPGETAGRLYPDDGPARRSAVRLRLRIQVLGPAEHAGFDDDRFDSGERESQRLQVVLDRQREIQRINYSKHIGQVMEVMVENPNSGSRADRRT